MAKIAATAMKLVTKANAPKFSVVMARATPASRHSQSLGMLKRDYRDAYVRYPIIPIFPIYTQKMSTHGLATPWLFAPRRGDRRLSLARRLLYYKHEMCEKTIATGGVMMARPSFTYSLRRRWPLA